MERGRRAVCAGDGDEKRMLGAEHPDTLTSMANLASTYRNQGRWKEAEELDCAGDGDEKKGAGCRASIHADQHGQPSLHLERARPRRGSP